VGVWAVASEVTLGECDAGTGSGPAWFSIEVEACASVASKKSIIVQIALAYAAEHTA